MCDWTYDMVGDTFPRPEFVARGTRQAHVLSRRREAKDR